MPVGPLPRCSRPGLAALMLLILASASAGCILPLAPEFQAVENAHPFVVRADPLIGSEVMSEDAVFVVTIQDPNPGDTLYARWLIDYPRFDAAVSREARTDSLPPTPEPPNEQLLRFQPDCTEHNISQVGSEHRLLLVVSDRPFIQETDPRLPNFLDSTPTSAGVIRSSWRFRKTCR